MTPDQYELEFVRYLDGASSPQDVERLNAVLLRDADARESLRSMAGQAVAMGDLARDCLLTARRRPAQLHASMSTASWRRWLAAAALVALLTGGLFAWIRPGHGDELQVAQVAGSVSLLTAAGHRSDSLLPGTGFSSGTIIVDGGTSSVQLIRHDGSSVMLHGPSEMEFPPDAQQPWSLRHGSLTAVIRPQPHDHPLRIRTPTAQADVLGTILRVDAQAEQTMLVVDEGHVRLHRLVDAAVVEVKQGETATATLDTGVVLTSHAFPPAPASWHATFEHQPPPSWHGTWLPPEADRPGRLTALLDLSYRHSDGTPVVAYTISAQDGQGGLVEVRPNSQLTLRLRMHQVEDLLILVSVRNPDGSFAGNFQNLATMHPLAPDQQGWRTLHVPLERLSTTWPKEAILHSGDRIGLLYIACYSADAGLELAEAAIDSPP